MVGAITLKMINPFRTGKLVLFGVTSIRDWHVFELPVFALLGVLGGIYGAVFIKLVFLIHPRIWKL
jgi:chloride channel 3/4/5